MRKIISALILLLSLGITYTFAQIVGEFKTIPGQYIVVLKDEVVDVPELANQLVWMYGGTPIFIYQHAIKGFAASLSEQAVYALSKNPNVAYIEPDSVVWACQTQEQEGATWGLDRIDERELLLDGKYTYDYTGDGVTAYIIDTGIRITHSEFGDSRAVYGYDFIDNDLDADDCNGHGTHVAGTVGGITYGVAKEVSLVAVRVLDCSGSGTLSGVIAGVDWVTAQVIQAIHPAVANMSLIGRFPSRISNNPEMTIMIPAQKGCLRKNRTPAPMPDIKAMKLKALGPILRLTKR